MMMNLVVETQKGGPHTYVFLFLAKIYKQVLTHWIFPANVPLFPEIPSLAFFPVALYSLGE